MVQSWRSEKTPSENQIGPECLPFCFQIERCIAGVYEHPAVEKQSEAITENRAQCCRDLCVKTVTWARRSITFVFGRSKTALTITMFWSAVAAQEGCADPGPS